MSDSNNIEEFWEKKKLDLINNIDIAMENGEADKEILELMKEFVKGTKVKSSIEDYFNEQKDDQGE